MTTRILSEQMEITDSLIERFNCKAKPCSSGCIEWTGALDQNGYGKIKIARKPIGTHVAAWRIANGGIPVPIGHVVMHSCDNRKCVNPLHLSCGTQVDNMDDCRAKGRLNVVCGVDCHNASFTDDLVEAIRRLYETGLSQRKVASKLNLNYPAVRAVIERRTWKHVGNDIATKSV